MRKIIFLIGIVYSSQVLAQSGHSHYIQQVDGTSLKFSMQAIPGGTFKMGSDLGNADEKPVHEVKLDPFWMGTYEVTWDLYDPFLFKDMEVRTSEGGTVPAEVDAVTRPTRPYLDMTFGMGKEGRPAVGMTHYNAIQFCKWLYKRTGVFYRLPTEAEWEYACRAGSSAAYYYGDDESELSDYAWYYGNSDEKVHQVGQKKPNAWGLYDMMGNVAEWVYDQYVPDFYQKSANTVIENPVAVPVDLYSHVVRGGHYESDAPDLRSAARMKSDPSWKSIDPQIPKSNWWFPEAPFVGIRLVRPLKTPTHDEIMAYYDKAPIADF